jgi:hypothetical protein
VSRFLIKSKPKMGYFGRLGSVFWMIGPIALAWSAWGFFASTDTSSKLIAGFVLLFSALATLAAPMLFFHGRSYEHEVTVLADE